MDRISELASVLLLVGCGAPEPDLPRVPVEPAPSVRVEPEAPLDAVPEVLRIHVEGASERSQAAPWLLFSGTLSDYHVGRIKKHDYPQTLIERQIAVQTWSDGRGKLTLAPGRVLELGATYSLASEVGGLIAELRVRSDAGLVFERIWPLAPEQDEVEAGRLLAYCAPLGAQPTLRFEAMDVELAPLGIVARAAPGIDASAMEAARCFHIELQALPPEASLLLPPAQLFGGLLEPSPMRVVAETAFEPVNCEAGDVQFGPACASVHDDRLIVSPPAAPLLWVLGGAVSTYVVSQPSQPFVVRGLAPESRHWLSGRAYDLHGTGQSFELYVDTGPAQPHLVLSEVLANPIGPEPLQEWVEIVNDGARPIALSGVVLEDVGGTSALPDVVLEPSEYALLVGAGFDEYLGFDIAPSPGTRVLRLTALGKSGLSNSGEPLRLRDASGAVLSSFPALPSKTAGISLARKSPDALDADPASFGIHAGAGASPGAPNEVLPEIPP